MGVSGGVWRLFVVGAVLVAAQARAERPPFADFDALFGTLSPAEAQALATRVAAAPTQADAARAYVRAHVESASFSETVLPLLFRAPMRAGFEPVARTLSSFTRGKKRVYHLGEPCDPAKAVRVRPWWSLKSTVWVCADSVREERTYDARQGAYCEAAPSNPPYVATDCGCGPFLMNCARDEEQLHKLVAAHRAQLLDTFAHVIRTRKPFSSVLTLPYSVRSSWTELLYARARYLAGAKFELALDEAPPTQRAYDPLFAAGVLGAPGYLYFDPSPRLTLFVMLEDFLCDRLRSTNVTAPEMFAVEHAGSARNKDHSELAAKPGCRTCHAKLENGLKSFWHLGGTFYAHRLLPERVTTEPLGFYLRDHEDLRATGKQGLPWFAQTIAAQPELQACMVHKVEDLIYGGDTVGDAAHLAAQRSFAKGEDLAALIEEVFVSRIGAADASAQR